MRHRVEVPKIMSVRCSEGDMSSPIGEQVSHRGRWTSHWDAKHLSILVVLMTLLSVGVRAGEAKKAPPAKPASPILPANITSKRIVLSHTDAKRCLEMLKVYGYPVSEPGKPINISSLPCAMALPSTTFHGLLNEKKEFPQTDTDPVNQLLVFYDVNKPEQFSLLRELIRNTLDAPARQIMIEAMVLEIGSSDLQQLGVEWELNRSGLSNGNWFDSHTTGDVRFGNVALENGLKIADPTLEATVTDIFGEFETRIEALVVSKKARVLSRPAVLTLDNRMAFINVAQKIPVAESKFSGSGNFTQVSFREITAGIQLTVRPRVSADDTEVGMQITASVSAPKPNGDVVINSVDSNGKVYEVARSPTISLREVKTYARIPNGTPFIIGGLVAQDEVEVRRKLPLLGDIPLLGYLFGSTDNSDQRREVIIVITPHVLKDDDAARASLPKDSDDFDSFGAELFRDAYRIRAEDIFNLRFLTENPELKRMQRLADQAVQYNADLENTYPFSAFCHGHFPGEEILVYRQIYEVIKRRQIENDVDADRLIFLTSNGVETGVGVSRLNKVIRDEAEREIGLADLYAAESGDRSRRKRRARMKEVTKALALTFVIEKKQTSEDLANVLLQLVPEVKTIDCPDRKTWSDKLWELNQPVAETGAERYTVLLRDEADLTRLKRAIVVRGAVDLNSRNRKIDMTNFALGHVLRMPTIKKDKVYMIDQDVAKYFFYTEQYYRAVGRELRQDSAAFQEALKKIEPKLKE